MVGNTVYAFTNRNGREGITALNAESGDTIWRTDYPVAYEPYEGSEELGPDDPRFERDDDEQKRGDEPERAREYYVRLPERDKKQIARRCRKFGIEF